MDREESVAGVEDPGSKSESVAGVGDLGRKGGGEAERPQPATAATRETDEKKEPRPTTAATAPVPAAAAPASLDLNALHKMSPEDLAELAKKFGVFLQPARTRHYHILDLMRAALGAGSTVTAEGVIDEPGESIEFLRSPNITFMPVLEDESMQRQV